PLRPPPLLTPFPYTTLFRSAFVFLDAFPLTPNGKVDRRALAASEPTQQSHTRLGVAPRSILEERLACMWQKMLHIEQISVYDSLDRKSTRLNSSHRTISYAV